MAFLSNKGIVDSGNSSTSALNTSAVFTGTWVDVSAYDSVSVAISTDQNGTIEVQFSSDGSNIDSTLTTYYKTTGINPPHRYTITRKYFRVVFANTSASNQTYFRLQSILGGQNALNIPTDSTMSQSYDAIVVRPTDYKYEVALGKRQGATSWSKFGYNSDIDIGTEVLAAQGGTFTFLTSASTLTIVSSSANDDGSPAGTGAQTITIYGIDANRDYQEEIVTMNGTTNVVTSSTWLGINRVVVSLAGSTFSNVGNITITATTGGTVQAYIPATKGFTQQLIFFTRNNHTALLDWIIINADRISGGTQPIVQFRAYLYNSVTNLKADIWFGILDVSTSQSLQLAPSQPFIVPEKCVFWIEATTDQNNTAVSGRFSGIEFRDANY